MSESRKDIQQDYKKDKASFTQVFNNIVGELNIGGGNDDGAPAFRLYKEISTLSLDTEILYLENITNCLKKIMEFNYLVEIVENLDVLDISEKERYEIRITNTNSKVVCKISFSEFKDNLLDYNFDPDSFILDKIKRIEGASDAKRIKEIKDTILEYLSYAIHFKQAFRYEYDTIGWDRYSLDNRTRFFKYDTIISSNPSIQGKISAQYAGDYTRSISSAVDTKEWDWYKFTLTLMRNHPFDSLIFAVGISGLLRQILVFTKESNLNVNIQGEPASGKSTIGHYVLSFWGNPDGLEGASIDTENAAERIRARRPVMPYVLDERMLRYMNESEKRQQAELMTGVFREYEGREKERLGKQYEDSTGNRIFGPILSSSVDSMLDVLLSYNRDLGQYRRFIELSIGKAEDAVLFNKDEAEKAETMANECFGYGIRYVIEYMLFRFGQSDDYFQDRFNKLVVRIKKQLADVQRTYDMHGMTSSSMRFALVVLSYQVLREAFIYKYYIEIKDMAEILKLDEGAERLHRMYNNFLYNIFDSEIEEDTDGSEDEEAARRAIEEQELVTHIKGYGESFDEYIGHANEKLIITDDSDKILEILIDNLRVKLGKVYSAVQSKGGLLEYIIKNSQEHPELFCDDIVNFNPDIHLCALRKDGGELVLQFIKTYYLDTILLGECTPQIPIEEIKKQGKLKAAEWKAFYKERLNKVYREVKPKGVGVSVGKAGNEQKVTLAIGGQERTTIITIPLTDFGNSIESEEE